MSQEIQPFSFKFSDNIPSLLHRLKCTLAISTYQAGKLIFLGSFDGQNITQMARNFPKPMGIGLEGDWLAIATLGEVLLLKNEPDLAANYPPHPGLYDKLYMPRLSYYTGMLDIHDVSWGEEGVWAVNTQYSCLSLITGYYSFEPKWKPNFITELAPEDRCHLNGLAMVDRKPAYVTALGSEDIAESWRKTKVSGGILMHVDSNEIIAKGLAMPHSPRFYDGDIYVLLSATGQLAKIDPQSGKIEILANLGGMVRGMSRIDNYLFIGMSKIRKASKGFQDLPIAKTADKAGILVFNLETGKVDGTIIYQRSVDEIYDVSVFPNTIRPDIITPEKEVSKFGVTQPLGSVWKVPKEK